jgi:biotin transport system substrate-specific component
LTTYQGSLASAATARAGIGRSMLATIALVLLGSAVTALLARIAIPLPFTPVPITGQTLGVLLVGAALGSKRGAASMLAYLAEGSVGLPVFAGGAAGPAVLVGPTGGYLFGFVLAAWLVGRLSERSLDRRASTALPAFAAGHLAIFACGVSWLAVFVGWRSALVGGLLPFIPGAAIKTALAALLLPAAWRFVGRGPRA